MPGLAPWWPERTRGKREEEEVGREGTKNDRRTRHEIIRALVYIGGEDPGRRRETADTAKC